MNIIICQFITSYLIHIHIGDKHDNERHRHSDRLAQNGLNGIHLAWAGGLEKRQGHYYRLQGPHFLVEYDNIQNDANHIHSVWRDPSNDFGADLLAWHYHESH